MVCPCSIFAPKKFFCPKKKFFRTKFGPKFGPTFGPKLFRLKSRHPKIFITLNQIMFSSFFPFFISAMINFSKNFSFYYFYASTELKLNVYWKKNQLPGAKKILKRNFVVTLCCLDKRNSLLHYRINHGSNEECHGAIGI